MKMIKKNIKKSLFLILSMFILLIIYFGYTLFIYSDRWFSDPSNTRVDVDMTNPSIIPGKVLDRNMHTLVETKKRNNLGEIIYYRDYSQKSRYATHVIGSKQLGIGVETQFIRYLLGYDNNLIEMIYQKAFANKEQGNNVILTIDIELQELASLLLGKNKGSIVVIDTKSGEILTMISHPTFNLQDTIENPKGEILVNKAVQGRYPPGSIMKLVTATAVLDQQEMQREFTLVCSGKTTIEEIVVNCAGERAHGLVDMSKAMEVSCNGYFARLAMEIGAQELKKTSERLGFNKELSFNDIICVKSELPISRSSSLEDLAWTGVGQGEVLVTPLHMALIASSIAGGGYMPEPKLLHAVQKWNGNIYYESEQKKILNTMSAQAAEELKRMMLNVVETGTGREAYREGLNIAGKTGTAEVGGDELPHAWFIGFAPADDPTVAISVIVENAGAGGRKAAPIAGEILEKAINLGH